MTGGAVLITNSTYNAGTKVYTLTIATSRSWVLGVSVAIAFPPNIPTVAVFDTKTTGADLSKKTKHFNVVRATFGTNRDFTINYQRCSIDLRGLQNSSAIDSQITQVGI